MHLSSLALQVGILFIRELPGDLAHGWRECNPDRLKHLAAGSLALGADGEPLAFLLNSNLLQGFEVLLDLRPLKAVASSLDTPIQLLLEDKSENTWPRMVSSRL